MLRKIPFKIWFFLLSVTILVTSVVQLPGASAGEASVLRYSRNKVGLDQAVLRYHNDMNKLVNDHIKKLFSITEDGDSYIVEPPEDKACSDQKNISTFCLGVRAVNLYDAFVQGMGTHRGFIQDKQDNEPKNINQLTGEFDRRLALINEQISAAGPILETTIGAYDQLQTFYPLHVQYSGLIESLESYRDGLSDVRKEIEKFPGSFHNVTTTACT